jgi:hypothetical protein
MPLTLVANCSGNRGLVLSYKAILYKSPIITSSIISEE